MNTILLINWPNIFTAVSILIFLGMFLFIAAFAVARLQAKKFIIEYEILKDFINEAPVNKEYYQAIYDMFNEMRCYSDNDKILVTQLWGKFEFKFRSFFPDSKKNRLPESMAELERNIFSKPRKVKVDETL